MLSVNNISMRFGPRVLFEDVTCTFMAGRRYAVTGPNGAGKSTFMKILTGELEPTKGSITAPKKMGVLRQDQFAFDESRVIDTVVMGNKALWMHCKSATRSTPSPMKTSPTRTACALVNSKASSVKKAATPPKPTPASCSTVSV